MGYSILRSLEVAGTMCIFASKITRSANKIRTSDDSDW